MWKWLTTGLLKLVFKGLCYYRPVHDMQSYDKGIVRRILLIMTTGIGDTLMCTPAISTIRFSFPDKLIGVLYHRRNRDLIIYNDDIDIFIEYPGKGRKVLSVVRELRKHKFDVAVVLHGNDPDIVPLAYLSGAKYIIGNCDSKFNFLLSQGIPSKGLLKHTIEYRLDSAKAIGADQLFYSMKLNIPYEQELKAQILLEKFSLPNYRLIGFVPVGSNYRNRWPSEYFARLGNMLCEYDKNIRILLFGGKADQKIISHVARGMRVKPVCFNGSLSLVEAAAMLKRCDAVISNDTGLMHMALALKVPVVAIYGAASPKLTGPYRCSSMHVILRKVDCDINEVCFDDSCGTVNCLRNILPGEVFNILKRDIFER